MADIEIEIDGKKCAASANQMIIQVADENDIYIPRFCYHKQLSIAANCRMCLVEVEKSGKPLPACATPVATGMKVFTRSSKALAAQRSVMEFLLINHPLDCPICDQGGECELQDLSMGYGEATSHFSEGKRAVKDDDIGPLIATEMTRCIHCTRCVRFGDEVAGLRELGAVGRGEEMEIKTYLAEAVTSEISGNVIDLCPVGALTSKPFRFTARAWELKQFPSIAAHDCLGTNIHVHVRNHHVMRIVPRENKAINDIWISDRDRYSYEGLSHPDRLTKPMIRENDAWREVDWQTALEFTANELKRIQHQYGGDSLGALASPNSTVEEFYLLQKLCRAWGSHHIDHRLRQVDFRDQEEIFLFAAPSLEVLEQCDTILLIGSHIQKEQPLAAIRLRKAYLKKATILAINPVDYAFSFSIADKKIVAPQDCCAALYDIVVALQQDKENAFANKIKSGKKVGIVLGALAINHPEASFIRELAQQLIALTQGTLFIFTEGANATGACIAGAIPHRASGFSKIEKVGMDAQAMLRDPRKAYLLMNVEPEFDCANPTLAETALQQAECVIALSLFRNTVLEKTATVILPMTPFTETSGTFINVAHEWQSFSGVAKPLGDARPAWKIIRVLGNLLQLPGFTQASSEEVLQEIPRHYPTSSHSQLERREKSFKTSHKKLTRIGEIPIYSVDSLVRHASALQTMQHRIEGDLAVLRLHPDTATEYNLKENELATVKQGNQSTQLKVIIDPRIAINAAWIAGGVTETQGLNELFGEIEVMK